MRVDAFQLHALFEAVLHCWHSLRLDTYEARLNIPTPSGFAFVVQAGTTKPHTPLGKVCRVQRQLCILPDTGPTSTAPS